MNFHELRGKYAGETAWIVGKGPSLAYLRSEYFKGGPVIALNQSILIVEELDLPNPIYSLQKDGCGIMEPHGTCAQRNGHDWMIRPKSATLIVQETKGYSRYCLADYQPRMMIDPRGHLKFQFQETMAIRMAIALAKIMGCASICLLCCGSLVNGNLDTFDVWTRTAKRTGAGDHYLHARPNVMRELVNMKYWFVIPEAT